MPLGGFPTFAVGGHREGEAPSRMCGSKARSQLRLSQSFAQPNGMSLNAANIPNPPIDTYGSIATIRMSLKDSLSKVPRRSPDH